jgi:hypothetical protein
MQFEMRHTIETDAPGFWALFFDRDFNRALTEHHGAETEILEERTDERGILHRRVEHRVPLKLPSFAKKIFGDGSCIEVGSYDAAAYRYCAQIIPKRGADKFMISAEAYTEPRGDKRCERVLLMENVVKIPGVGRAMEKLLEVQQRDAQTRMVGFVNDYLLGRSK